MARARILAVDDEPGILELCREVLNGAGYQVETAAGADAALDRLQENRYDLMVTDLRMPGQDGIALIEATQSLTPDLPVVVITGYPGMEGAMESVRHGAVDLITKPFDTVELCRVVERSLAQASSRSPHTAGPEELLGESPAMTRLRKILDRAAATDSTILVEGESGTGKELVARTLHSRSRRRLGPFMVVDCATLQMRLVDKGRGRDDSGSQGGGLRAIMTAARDGSVFLDDVDNLSPSLQSRLLRLLDQGSASMASGKGVSRRPRVIAASRSDLRAAVAAGRFREDLYFRLNVIPLRVPPLRERGSDLAVLAHGVLAEFSRLRQDPPVRITEECLDALAGYPWPGNVRELRNVVERMVSLADGKEVTVNDIPSELMANATTGVAALTPGECEIFREAKRRTVVRFERDYIHRILGEHEGNVTRSAEAAGLNRSAFQRLMRKHGLRSRSYRSDLAEFRG
jgi:DNA-binding NtrC family response regulator